MPAIIPHPQQITIGAGHFALDATTRIVAAPEAAGMAAYLAASLAPATGFTFETALTREDGQANTIHLALSPDATEHDEGYRLTVRPDGVTIAAATERGLFYGIQTLRQLLPPAIEADSVQQADWTVPAQSITDWPRYRWRGLMLDVGRHMMPVDFIKKFLDLMALHKFNVFHWHLTEDQGWRIEIKAYAKLTKIGSGRASTPIPADRQRSDDTPYGGYYTRAEVREIVAYAAERFITVVPEIEMPGHALAALAAYPHLGCVGQGYEVATTWGIFEDVYCAGNEAVYGFLEDVLREVFELFPSEYIHVGGDECPKTRWAACPKCQARKQQEGLRTEEQLQSYFIERMERFINANGRRLVGWDEILEGGLAPNATVMSWRGIEGGIAAARAGHDVVMSPTSHCYFDYYQAEDWDAEPPAIGNYIPLSRVHAFDPCERIPADRRQHVLGGQGNIWTEYMPTPAQVEYMVYPRACALAESLWTADDDRAFDEFSARLAEHLARLDRLAVSYRPLG